MQQASAKPLGMDKEKRVAHNNTDRDAHVKGECPQKEIKIVFIKKHRVMFEGTSVKELRKAFHEAVDDYLGTCKEMCREPQKPFKGSFNVRIPSDLHRKAVERATRMGVSLNQLVQKALEEKVAV